MNRSSQPSAVCFILRTLKRKPTAMVDANISTDATVYTPPWFGDDVILGNGNGSCGGKSRREHFCRAVDICEQSSGVYTYAAQQDIRMNKPEREDWSW